MKLIKINNDTYVACCTSAIRPYVRDTTTESSARDFSYSKRERHKFLEMAFVADKYVINYVKEQTHNYLLLNAHIVSKTLFVCNIDSE